MTVMIDKQAGEGSQGAPTAFLDVRDLRVHFPTDDGLVKSVDGISFTLDRGSKGTKAQLGGQIWLDGTELIAADAEDVRKLRGNKMAMIFQDPLSSLHPFYTIGDQIVEAYRVHNDASKKEAWTRTIDMLDRVGIPNAKDRAKDYPHQFSGGMRQRAIIELMIDLQKEFGSAIIIITHDLGVVAEIAKDVMVMYAGRGIEYSKAEDVFYRPEHPYTWGLLSSVTRLDRVREDRLRPIPGSPPSLLNVPPGCPFSPRCTYRNRNGIPCQTVRPDLELSEGTHLVSCHLPAADRRQAFITDIKPNL